MHTLANIRLPAQLQQFFDNFLTCPIRLENEIFLLESK